MIIWILLMNINNAGKNFNRRRMFMFVNAPTLCQTLLCWHLPSYLSPSHSFTVVSNIMGIITYLYIAHLHINVQHKEEIYTILFFSAPSKTKHLLYSTNDWPHISNSHTELTFFYYVHIYIVYKNILQQII